MTSDDVKIDAKAKTKPAPKKPASVKPAPVKPSTVKVAAKPAVKPATTKTVTAPAVVKAKAKTVKPVKTVAVKAAEPVLKPKKSKLVRDSFTIPDHEYKLIQTLKARAVGHGLPLKKSELIRAGILKLVALGEAEFKKAISAVDIIKTGRPTKAK